MVKYLILGSKIYRLVVNHQRPRLVNRRDPNSFLIEITDTVPLMGVGYPGRRVCSKCTAVCLNNSFKIYSHVNSNLLKTRKRF